MRWLYSAGSCSRPTRSRMRNGSALHTTTSARELAPVASTTPLTRAAVDAQRLDALVHLDDRAVLLRLVRQHARDRAHAALDDHPRAVGAGQAAHVVDEEVHAGAGRVPRAVEPGESVGDGVHRAHQIALEVEAVEVVADRLAAQIDERLAQRRAHVLLRGLLDRQRLLHPGGRDVVADLARSRRSSPGWRASPASEKKSMNCRFIASWSLPNSR